MADKTWILWLLGIIGAVAVVLYAVSKGRRVAVGGKGLSLNVDGQAPASTTAGIKAVGVKARNVVAREGTGRPIDVRDIDAVHDVVLQTGAKPDPKDN